MKCKQTVCHQNKVEKKQEFKPIAVIFFPLHN